MAEEERVFDFKKASEDESQKVPQTLRKAIKVAGLKVKDELRDSNNLQNMFTSQMGTITEEFAEYLDRMPEPGSHLTFQDRMVLHNSMKAREGMKKICLANQSTWINLCKANLKRKRRQQLPKTARPRREEVVTEVEDDALMNALQSVDEPLGDLNEPDLLLRQRRSELELTTVQEGAPIPTLPEKEDAVFRDEIMGQEAVVNQDIEASLPSVPVAPVREVQSEQPSVNTFLLLTGPASPAPVPDVRVQAPSMTTGSISAITDLREEWMDVDAMDVDDILRLIRIKPKKRTATPGVTPMCIRKGPTRIPEAAIQKLLNRKHHIDIEKFYYVPTPPTEDPWEHLRGIPDLEEHMKKLDLDGLVALDNSEINLEEMFNEAMLRFKDCSASDLRIPSGASTPLFPLRGDINHPTPASARELTPIAAESFAGVLQNIDLEAGNDGFLLSRTPTVPQGEGTPLVAVPQAQNIDLNINLEAGFDELGLVGTSADLPRSEFTPLAQSTNIDLEAGICEFGWIGTPAIPPQRNDTPLALPFQVAPPPYDENVAQDEVPDYTVAEAEVEETLRLLWSQSGGEITFADLCPLTQHRCVAANTFDILLSFWGTSVELRQTSCYPAEIFISQITNTAAAVF